MKSHVVIMTALSLEYDEVRSRLRNLTTRVHPAGTRFEVGRLDPSGCLVALTLGGKGNLPTAALTERSIREFAPAAMIFTGVAGAFQPHIALGDVVIATHVYAYHGATSEMSGTRARPRVWEVRHTVDQAARYIAREGGWARQLLPGSQAPRVHFGPIAAGDRVIDSASSPDATWIREHYNDTLAVEMEAAGIAQAGHLNDSLPIAVVRGISDSADGTKASADEAGWQPRAAARAAAFALALASELGSRPTARAAGPREEAAQDTPVVPMTVTNLAAGHARVGVQAGQILGGVHGAGRGDNMPPADLPSLLADLSRQIDQAYQEGRVEEEIRQAAIEEITDAAEAARHQQGKQLMVAVRRLSGLIGDLAEFAARLAAIVTAAKGLS